MKSILVVKESSSMIMELPVALLGSCIELYWGLLMRKYIFGYLSSYKDPYYFAAYLAQYQDTKESCTPGRPQSLWTAQWENADLSWVFSGCTHPKVHFIKMRPTSSLKFEKSKCQLIRCMWWNKIFQSSVKLEGYQLLNILNSLFFFFFFWKPLFRD